jgi:hypothetical protein
MLFPAMEQHITSIKAQARTPTHAHKSHLEQASTRPHQPARHRQYQDMHCTETNFTKPDITEPNQHELYDYARL